MSDSAVAQVLSDQVLSNRLLLPAKMTPTTLSGSRVKLVPLDVARDSQALFSVSNGSSLDLPGTKVSDYDSDALIWRFMGAGPFANINAFEMYLEALVSNANGLAMCVYDIGSGRPVGVATFMNNFPEHLKVELGNIWYSPVVQGKGANLEATYLMLEHAFSLGYRRVEWKCDASNERSRRAALRMGFRFEGVQEFHFIVKERNRDTAWFRMLDHEWHSQKGILESIIY